MSPYKSNKENRVQVKIGWMSTESVWTSEKAVTLQEYRGNKVAEFL